MPYNVNKGRKQTEEHIAKRVAAIKFAKSQWNEERSILFRARVSSSSKGRSAWNKGVRFSEEHIKKMSESHKGIQSGENHPMYGKKHTEEAKRKNALAHTGKKQSPEVIKKRFESRAGYKHSEETKKKIGLSNYGESNGMFGRNGELNPTWKGGTSFEPYPITWSFRLRESIRNRDGRKCRVCGVVENGKRHDVHHIDYNKNNVSHDNLVTLCHPCHMKTNYNQEPWKAFFQKQSTPGVNSPGIP